MARVNTGDYRIKYYDGYGGNLKAMDDEAKSYEGAKGLAYSRVKETLHDGDKSTAKSFTIDRRLFNSLEAKWPT